MKHIRMLALLLALTVALLAGICRADVIYGPGLVRADGAKGYEQAQVIADRYGVALTDGMPLYKPANAQPLNAYMVVDPECQVGIDRDDMYKVSEKGLVPEITGYLDAWIDAIESASGGVIRFVGDPDEAEVLVSARQSFKRYGDYSGGGMSAEGYSCTVTLSAVQLTNKDNRCGFSETNVPQSTVTLRGGGRFWKTPPELAGSDKLTAFVNDILNWYGIGAGKGSKGAAVRRMQQSLIRRYFLGGSADGAFGPRTEAAVKSLQEAYSMEKTGIVDGKTLIGIFYDHAAMDEVS